MGFPRQGYWSEEPFPSPGDLPNPGMELTSPSLADGFFTTQTPGNPRWWIIYICICIYKGGWQFQTEKLASIKVKWCTTWGVVCRTHQVHVDKIMTIQLHQWRQCWMMISIGYMTLIFMSEIFGDLADRNWNNSREKPTWNFLHAWECRLSLLAGQTNLSIDLERKSAPPG